MAQTKFLYEILIRGSKDGQISGAHQVWAQSITDDVTGADLGVVLGPATVLNPADVKSLIDASFVGLSNQIAALQADKRELSSQLDAVQQALSEALQT